MDKNVVKSPNCSLKGWQLKKFLEGNLKSIKEICKVLLPLLAGLWLVDNPALVGLITVCGKAGFDIFEYWIKQY